MKSVNPLVLAGIGCGLAGFLVVTCLFGFLIIGLLANSAQANGQGGDASPAPSKSLTPTNGTPRALLPTFPATIPTTSTASTSLNTTTTLSTPTVPTTPNTATPSAQSEMLRPAAPKPSQPVANPTQTSDDPEDDPENEDDPNASRNGGKENGDPNGSQNDNGNGRAGKRPVIAPQTQVSFQSVKAQDGSFTAKIPSDWKLTGTSIRFFEADGAQGDKVYSAAIDVPSDPQSLQTYVQVMQARGVQFTQEEMEILSQLVSPPLSPEDIVQQLFPRLSLGTVQDVTVVESQDLPEGVAQALGDVQSKLVHFRYSLVRNDEGNTGSVPMEGAVLVTTLPGVYTGVLHYWTFMIAGGDGPQQTFDYNRALYVAILSTLRYDSTALAQNQLPPISNDWIRKQLQIPFNNMWYHDPGYWRDMQGFIASLGAQYYYRDPKDPSNDGYINQEDIPDTRSEWWMCPVAGYARNIPVPSNGGKPDNLCYPMPPPTYTGNR